MGHLEGVKCVPLSRGLSRGACVCRHEGEVCRRMGPGCARIAMRRVRINDGLTFARGISDP